MKEKKQLVIGRKPVIDLLKEGQPFERIFIQNQITGEFRSEVLQQARALEIPVQFVPRIKLDKLSRGNHQGVVAMTAQLDYQQAEALVAKFFDEGKEPCMAVLDGITDVRNFGAIARSAEALGIDALLIGMKNSAPVNDVAVKTSAGALLRIPVSRTHNLPKTLQSLKEMGLRITMASSDNANPIYDMNLTGPLACILGSEGEGVHPAIAAHADFAFHIPQYGVTESLNVSVAAGIVFYEIMRQRKTLSLSLR